MKNNVILVSIFLVLLPLIYGQCTAGFYLNSNSQCVACPPGTYSTSNQIGISNCIPCSAGSFSNAFGKPNCTACTEGFVCSRGSPRPFAQSELTSKIIDPSSPFIAQNWKIGFVFIMMLIFVIPLIAFGLTCWDPTLCGFFDTVYNEKHYIHQGDARIKKKESCGGFFFLIAMALFSMAFGAIVVDFYFSNIFRIGKFQPSLQVGRTFPHGNFTVMGLTKLVGLNSSDCQAATISTGYNVQIGGSLISGCTSSGNICTCNTTCTHCALASAQTLKITFSNERVFASSIFYTYSVSHFGELYSVNGTILPPSDTIFYGSATPHTVRMTLFPAYLHGIQGGNFGGAQWSQWVDTFIHDFRYNDRGLIFQVEDVAKGTSVANLTGSGGLVFSFEGNFGPYDYIVEETFRQTVWNHVAELVSICILFLFVGYIGLMVYEFLAEKWEEQVAAGRVKLALRYIKTPFRVVWRSLLNLCRKEKLSVWAHSEEEKSDEEGGDKIEKGNETKETLERLNDQIHDLDNKLTHEAKPKTEEIVIENTLPVEPVHQAEPIHQSEPVSEVKHEEKPLLVNLEQHPPQPNVVVEQPTSISEIPPQEQQ